MQFRVWKVPKPPRGSDYEMKLIGPSRKCVCSTQSRPQLQREYRIMKKVFLILNGLNYSKVKVYS